MDSAQASPLLLLLWCLLGHSQAPAVLFLATRKAPAVGGTPYKAFGARVRGIEWDRKDGFSGGVLSALTEDLDLVPRTYIGQLTTLYNSNSKRSVT